LGRSGDIVAAIATGADAVMLGSTLARAQEAPGQGWHWGPEAHHPTMPRGYRAWVGHDGPLEEVLYGPAHSADGRTNLMGALRHSMATCGYSDLKEFQRVDIVVSR
jgi:IMP dehydrogenase